MNTQAQEQRLALITGGSSGIGRAIVLALSQKGYKVAFSYRLKADAALAVVRDVEESGGAALAIRCDVSNAAEVDDFLDEAVNWAGTAPQALVNNAGIQTWCGLLELEEAAWDAVIGTNLKGCFLHTQKVGRLMAEARKGGSIVNIGSGCNKVAFPNLVDYTASKGGIEQFTKSAAIELGPHGINVNCVAPGAIVIERTLDEAPDYADVWSKITPLGRVGTPEDVANAVLFFLGRDASFVTGQTLWVDGGVFTRAPWPYA